MSELAKKLEQVSRGNEQPLGFGTRSKAKNAEMILIARLEQVNSDVVGWAISGGADAVLFDIDNPIGQAEAISQMSGMMGSVPWGVRIGSQGAEGMEILVDSGCDYVVMTALAPAQILREEKLGKVLEIDMAVSDSVAEGICKLSADAVVITDDDQGSPLTIGRLMDYQRISELTGKTVLTRVSNTADLEGLLEADVRGIINDVKAADGDAELVATKERIRNLSAPKKMG